MFLFLFLVQCSSRAILWIYSLLIMLGSVLRRLGGTYGVVEMESWSSKYKSPTYCAITNTLENILNTQQRIIKRKWDKQVNKDPKQHKLLVQSPKIVVKFSTSSCNHNDKYISKCWAFVALYILYINILFDRII